MFEFMEMQFFLLLFTISFVSECQGIAPFVKDANGIIEISCDYYKVAITATGNMEVYSIEGDLLIRGFPKFVANYRGWDIQTRNPQQIHIDIRGNRVTLSYAEDLQDVEVNLIYTFKKESPYLRLQSRITYKNGVYPLYEYLSFRITERIGRIMTRDERFNNIQGEKIYVTDSWTPKVVLLGEGERSVSLIGFDNAQSMEVVLDSQDIEVKLVFDDAVNHPHFYFPFYGDHTTKVDLSRTTRTAGDTVTYYTVLSIGREEKIVAKWRQPYGYEAALIFSEHTDGSDIATTNAIAYGTSDTLSDFYGRGGILGNSLTYTKSVWLESSFAYNGSDGLDNPAYKALCDKLDANGVEIIPHTITNETDTREDIENGFSYLKQYHSRNWIDHSGARNLEDLAHFGWNRLDEHYIVDIMDKYNYKYAWAYIDLDETQYLPPRENVSWYTGEDGNLLVPLKTENSQPILFYNNNIDDNTEDEKRIYFWTTVSCYTYGDLEKYYTPEKVDKLIDERGVHISHHYFSLQKNKPLAPCYLTHIDTSGVGFADGLQLVYENNVTSFDTMARLLLNPGFETGDLSGYFESQGGYTTIVDLHPMFGNYCAMLTTTGNNYQINSSFLNFDRENHLVFSVFLRGFIGSIGIQYYDDDGNYLDGDYLYIGSNLGEEWQRKVVNGRDPLDYPSLATKVSVRIVTHKNYTNKWVIDSLFNEYLSGISSRQREGRLWVPTLVQFADHLIPVSNVEVIPQDDGLYKIHTIDAIDGFSLVTKDEDIKDIYIDGIPVSDYKINDSDRIFWFDLSLHSTHNLYFTTSEEYPNTYLLESPSDEINPGEEIKFKWTGTDNKDTDLEFSFSLDEEAFSSFSNVTEISYQNLPSGLHCFRVRARDLDGNIDRTSSQKYFFLNGEEESVLPAYTSSKPFPNPFSISKDRKVFIYAPNASV
ncbi:MAG: hypothetical protein Q7J55_05825, partial [bacterium]|nr:hypothetical protein [bacterium]